MPPDGHYTAVLDRIEAGTDEDLVVLVLETDGEAVDELIIAVDALPPAAREPDTVLEVLVEDGELASVLVEEAETRQRQESAQDRFERLFRRPVKEGEEDSSE